MRVYLVYDKNGYDEPKLFKSSDKALESMAGDSSLAAVIFNTEELE